MSAAAAAAAAEDNQSDGIIAFPPLPEDLAIVLTTEEKRGFGFQWMGNDYFTIAKVRDAYDDEDELGRVVGAVTAKAQIWNHFTGTFIKVHWSAMDNVPTIIDAVLPTHIVDLWMPWWACFVKGTKFSRVQAELNAVAAIRNSIDSFPPGNSDVAFHSFKLQPNLLEHHNWITAEGKQVCSFLREGLKLPPISDALRAGSQRPARFLLPNYDTVCTKYNILHRSKSWGAYVPTGLTVDEPLLAIDRGI